MLLSLAGVGLTETLEGDIEKIMKYLLSRFAGLFIAVTLLLSSLLGYGAAPALAAVGLTSFEVTPAGNNTDLRITWTTETEVDTIAFRLKRSTATDAASATDVVTLPALGAGVGGGSYEHIDRGLTTGTAYYYWLYEVTTSGDVSPIGERINATPGQSPGVTPAPTNTQSATATSTPTTRPTTTTPTATTQATQANNAPSNTATFTPVPTNTSAPNNTPFPTNTSAPAAAANAPAVTDTPPPASTPANPEAVATTANLTDAGAPETQPAPAIDGEQTPAIDSGERNESTDQGQVVPTGSALEANAIAPTGLTSVETSTAQAVAQVEAAPTSAPEAQPTVVRPTATPRPSQSGESSSTTGLLAVIGGGSLCAAALLALVAIFIWRRR